MTVPRSIFKGLSNIKSEPVIPAWTASQHHVCPCASKRKWYVDAPLIAAAMGFLHNRDCVYTPTLSKHISSQQDRYSYIRHATQ